MSVQAPSGTPIAIATGCAYNALDANTPSTCNPSPSAADSHTVDYHNTSTTSSASKIEPLSPAAVLVTTTTAAAVTVADTETKPSPHFDQHNVEEDVVLLGDMVWAYVVLFKNWVMRNPKTFSSMLVSIMLVLFTKYAQDIVIDVVELVVKAHPAVYPTDELRSKTAILNNELKSYINVAKTTGAAYVGRGVSCSNISSVVQSEFLTVPYALQTAFGISLYFAYVSYLIPGTTHWGDCGCQGWSQSSADAAICSYVDTKGNHHAFNGPHSNDSYADSIPNAFVDNADYIQVIKGLTVADQAAGGVWQTATSYDDPFLKQTFVLLTYSYPILFDATGNCIAAVSVDISTNRLAQYLQTRQTSTEVILVGYGRGSDTLKFITDSHYGSINAQTYPATQTPVVAINSAVATVANYADHYGNVLGVFQNVSFLQDAMIYQALTVLDTMAVVAVGPTTQSSPQISDAFVSLLSEFERSAQALRASYLVTSVSCFASADARATSLFVRELSNLLLSFGPQVYGAYLAYTVGGGSFGACGCEQLSISDDASANASVGKTSQSCFYVDSSSSLLRFSNLKNPSDDATVSTFTDTRRNSLLSDLLPSVTRANISTMMPGVWTKPYAYFDPTNSVDVTLVSFVLPIAFDPVTQSCSSAIVMDVSLMFVPQLLSKFSHGGQSDIHLIDAATMLYMGNANSWFSADVYSVTTTPNATINALFTEVLARGAGSIDLSYPVPSRQIIVNYARIGSTRWALVEVMQSGYALNRFLPIPSITSSSQALSLLPMDVNLSLFGVVLTIIALFTLNLFILGCSTVGDTGAAQPPVSVPAGGK